MTARTTAGECSRRQSTKDLTERAFVVSSWLLSEQRYYSRESLPSLGNSLLRLYNKTLGRWLAKIDMLLCTLKQDTVLRPWTEVGMTNIVPPGATAGVQDRRHQTVLGLNSRSIRSVLSSLGGRSCLTVLNGKRNAGSQQEKCGRYFPWWLNRTFHYHQKSKHIACLHPKALPASTNLQTLTSYCTTLLRSARRVRKYQ